MKKRMTVLVSTMAALTCVTVGAATVTFSDINNVPWEGAKNYIVKVADLGLMVGEQGTDGTSIFRAKDKVTYCETTQLIYNILKGEGKAKPSAAVTAKYITVMKSYKIPEWAYEAVAYCLDNKIISANDLAGFVTTAGVSKNATREDVAVIFGKALSSDVKENPDLDFNDKATISKAAAPYINFLVKEDILVGDAKKNFNPKNLINRAEMAVVTTKTYSFVSDKDVDVADKTSTGAITSISGSGNVRTIDITPSNGTKITLTGVKGTPTTKKGASVDFFTLSAGDNITAKYTGSIITSVVVNSDFAAEETATATVTGTLNNITGGKVAVNLSDGGSSVYTISQSAGITLNGDSSTVSKISKVIDNGVTLDVILKVSGQTATAIAVTGKENVVEGVIKDISSKEIEIKRTGGTAKVFYFADYVKVNYDGESSRVSKLVDAFDGERELFVTAQVDDSGDIEKLTVTYSQAGGTVTGLVKKMTDEKISISLSPTKSEGYSYSGEPKVVFEDEDSTFSKLMDKVENGTSITAKLYLNSQKQVTKIEATLEDNNTGTISSLTDTYITILTKGGFTRKCLIADDVVIRYEDGSNVKLKDFKEVFVEGETKVVLTLNNKETVVKIVANLDEGGYDRTSGTVNAMGETSLKVGKKTVYFSKDTVVKIDGEASTTADLYKRYQAGEEMDASVSYSDDIARNVSAEVTGISGNLASMKKGYISIATDGGTREYKITSEAEDFVVRYNGEKKVYDFQDLYERWYVNGESFNLECTIENGAIVKVEAEAL